MRAGATVFELGTPNRKSDEFRHGEDYWAPGTPPKLGFPTPVWGGQMEFPLDFPDGMTYTVGKSQWTKDWNYVLPAMADASRDLPALHGHDRLRSGEGARGRSAGVALSRARWQRWRQGDRERERHESRRRPPESTGTPHAMSARRFRARRIPTRAAFISAITDLSATSASPSRPSCCARAGTRSRITMDTRKMTAFLMVDYLRLELPGYVPPAPAERHRLRRQQRRLGQLARGSRCDELRHPALHQPRFRLCADCDRTCRAGVRERREPGDVSRTRPPPTARSISTR